MQNRNVRCAIYLEYKTMKYLIFIFAIIACSAEPQDAATLEQVQTAYCDRIEECWPEYWEAVQDMGCIYNISLNWGSCENYDPIIGAECQHMIDSGTCYDVFDEPTNQIRNCISEMCQG